LAPELIVIAGPTGAGKSDLAIRLALALDGEIVNYDSVQIYRGFDIGSAKPPAETRRVVPHHLFDIRNPDEEFNAAEFARLAEETCAAIHARGRVPVLVGGTFFYLRAFLAGLPEMPGRNDEVRARLRAVATKPRGPMHLHAWLSRVDPRSAARIPPPDRHRVERALEIWLTSGRSISDWQPPSAASAEKRAAIKIGLSLDRPELVARIEERVDAMYAAGLVDETRRLLGQYPAASPAFSTIGYKEAAAVVREEMTLVEAIAETKRRTRAYAKRQMTWLRSERNMQWLDAADRQGVLAAALRLIGMGSG
jgi:tRNA dimethylallyltransferase